MSLDGPSINLKADTTQIKQAAIDLDTLSASGDKAEASAVKLEKTVGQVSATRGTQASTERQVRVEMDAATSATERMTLGQIQFLEKLQRQVDTVNLSKKALLEYEAAELGVTRGAQGYIDKIVAATESQKGHGLSLESNIAKIEALRIAHDAAIGSYSRMGSAMLVMSNATGLSAMAFSAAGLAAIGLLAPIGFLAAAFYAGTEESKKFNASLVETGNYSGLTKSSFQSLSASIADATGGSIGTAKDALQALASTGRITADSMGLLGRTMIEQARVTGQSLDDIAKDYAKMPDGVARWAEQHNQSMHFMGLAQYEHIRLLEEQGKTQQAMIEVSKSLDAQFASHVEHLGYLESALKKTSSAWSTFWNWTKGIGADKTAQDGIDDQTRKILEFRAQLARLNPNDQSVNAIHIRANLEKALSEQSLQQSQLLEEKKFAAFTAERARISEISISAKDYNDRQIAAYDKKIGLEKALQAQQLKFDQQAAGGDPVSAANQQSIMSGIRAGFAGKAAGAASTSSYDAFIANIQKYAAAADLELSVGAKLTESQKFQSDGLSKLQSMYLNGPISIGQFVAAQKLLDEAFQKGEAKDRERERLDSLRRAMEEITKERVKYMDSMEKESSRIEDQARKQLDQNAAIGKSKDALLYLEAARDIEKAQGLEAIARKTYEQDLDMDRYEATMKAADSYRSLAASVKAAADEQYKLSHDGAYSYFKSIEDRGVSTAKAVSKAFKGMEDSLTTFAMTGKLDFSDMANSIISSLIRIQIQQSITGPLSKYASDSGGVGSLLSSMFSFDGGGYTGGGSRSGGVDGKGGFMAIMHPQESVIDHTKGQSGGGGGGSVTVNVIEDSSKAGTQQQRTTSTGGNVVDVFVAQVKAAIASDISRGSGAIPNAMQQAYGVNRVAGAY